MAKIYCKRCSVEMLPGIAIQGTMLVGLPDFPNQTDLVGQTVSEGGPGVVVDALKCPSCGHSVTRKPTDGN